MTKVKIIHHYSFTSDHVSSIHFLLQVVFRQTRIFTASLLIEIHRQISTRDCGWGITADLFIALIPNTFVDTLVYYGCPCYYCCCYFHHQFHFVTPSFHLLLWWPVDSFLKEPVMWNAFRCHDTTYVPFDWRHCCMYKHVVLPGSSPLFTSD